MKLLVVVFAGTLICAGSAVAQNFAKPLNYSVPGMDKADVRSDIVYRQDGADELKMDIAMPPGMGADERRPAVFFIHGGPLGRSFSPKPKDWGVFKSYGRLMAASGLVGVTFDHRYYGMKEEDLERSFADVEEAIRFVRSNAAAYHVNPDRIALWAFSGGGPHLTIALRGQTPYIRCLVSYYAVLGFKEREGASKEAGQALARFSPLARLSSPPAYIPPVLIGRAGLDSPDINWSVEQFILRMFALNADINLLDHPQGRHGFDLYNDDAQTRDVIAATVAFVQSRLHRPDAAGSR